MHVVAHRYAETAVLADALGALHGLARLATHRARSVRVRVGRTLDAGGRALLMLEKVARALGARRETGVGVRARQTLGAATLAAGCGWLVGEGAGRTSLTVLAASRRRLAGVSVPRALEAGHEAGRRVRAVAAHRYAVLRVLRAFFLGVTAGRALHARALTVAALVETFRARLALPLDGERPGGAVH